ncbi:CAMK protein kinase [Thecamonas trahens ATCC 50062]|uniref:CAMK protein kinase n=1 Tax=Thecamonas trahens ATCC 50062 TaxID=461836 RepID=A0A0L0DI23_THETB|nr:CAMK protein kinase [Thecamonas trahens ATCC 50062]KNC52019.1 CAMK protein kinase [Thecamonas trahens ATCC 50062]|eukprot:XP_013755602.1 CAMK protein kinase [Thecamonas trahens ATCC 50062]
MRSTKGGARSKGSANERRGSTSSALERRRRISLAIDGDSMGELVREVEDYYEILDVLGQGAYGTVYRCRDVVSGEEYAIKTVELKKTDESSFKGLLYEVGIMKRLHHKSVVQLKRVMQTDMHMYIVMELCEFELRDRVSSAHPLSEAETRVVMKQLLEAIGYMHSQRIAHRDLKPANILLVKDDLSKIKVSDFGLSYRMDSDHVMDDKCGTPAYMAPEVINDRQVYSEKCDVWSLGIIMYVLLVGKLPFRSKSTEALFALIAGGEYSLPPHVPLSDLGADLLARLLAVNPIERYSAAEALTHPWLTGQADADAVIQPTMFEMLLSFKARARLRKAMHVVLATAYLWRGIGRSATGSELPPDSPAGIPADDNDQVSDDAAIDSAGADSGSLASDQDVSLAPSVVHNVVPLSISRIAASQGERTRKLSPRSIVAAPSSRKRSLSGEGHSSMPMLNTSAADAATTTSGPPSGSHLMRASPRSVSSTLTSSAKSVPSYMRATTASSKKTRRNSPAGSARGSSKERRSAKRG